jgi:hypothetical protein
MRRDIPTAITAVLMLAVCPRARGEDAEALARRILRAAGRPVGLVHMPRCGGGALAVALAEIDKGLRLHGQDADGARVRAAQGRQPGATRPASVARPRRTRQVPAGRPQR